MFIKLTKLDGRPVWLNASFVVTVEPRRDGYGSVVVPIGDGLDYDVKESVDTVLSILANAPTPAVVPVPVSDCLTKTPDDVSPEPERGPRPPMPPPARPQSPKPAAQPPKPAIPPPPPAKSAEAPAQPADASASDADVEAAVAAELPVIEEKKSRKRTTRPRKTAAAKTEEAKAEAPKADEPKQEASKEVPSAPPPPPPPPPPPARLELADDQILRLAKLAPKTVTKLKNTLVSQFHVADIGATVLGLQAKGVFTLDGSRVVWPAPIPLPVPIEEQPIADW